MARRKDGMLMRRPEEDPHWSYAMLDSASKDWPQVLIFWDTFWLRPSHETIPTQSLREVIQTLGFHNIDLVSFSSKIIQDANEVWKRRIIAYGGTVKTVKNPLEINYMFMEKYIEGDFITWAGVHDHHHIGIEVDKPKTFLELAKERESRSKW